MSATTPPLRHDVARSLSLALGTLVDVPADATITDLTLNSRQVVPGAAFLACEGRTRHGLEFAPQAVAAGASVVLYEPSPRARVPAFARDVLVAPVADLSRRAGEIADRFFGEPSAALTVAGITGTNGKTTCAWLLAHSLTRLGRRAAYAGTLGSGVVPDVRAGEYTTPDAVTVQRELAQLREQGAECVAMEVSSHALDQHRVGGVRFHTAAFTNLTRDHLDYHGTMDAYGAAKARLFDWDSLVAVVLNVDDPFGAELAMRSGVTQRPTLRRLFTTRSQDARWPAHETVRAIAVSHGARGLVIEVDCAGARARLATRLVGAFNVDNVLTVLAILTAWDVPLASACAAIEACSAPPGRMETFGGADRPLAIVDYAHTPDALRKALEASRAHCTGRLVVVFGCGGDRDAGKRPLMAAVASELADAIVVTDDNPRSESPAAIVADILRGVRTGAKVEVEHDRAAAIRGAIAAASAGDVVLIAGKGHEDYQIYGAERRAFSDQRVVRLALGEAA